MKHVKRPFRFVCFPLGFYPPFLLVNDEHSETHPNVWLSAACQCKMAEGRLKKKGFKFIEKDLKISFTSQHCLTRFMMKSMSWKIDVIILASSLHCTLIWLQEERRGWLHRSLASAPEVEASWGRGQLQLPDCREQRSINVAQLHKALLKIIGHNYRPAFTPKAQEWPGMLVGTK